MKKYILKLTSLFLFAAVLTSCDEDKVIYKVDGGQSLVAFNEDGGNLPAYSDQEYTLEIPVGSTVRTSYDRKIELTVNDQFTTALPSEYTIDESSLVIPANEFVGTVKIKANYSLLPDLGQKVLALNLVSVQDADVINPDKNLFSVYLYRACPKDIALKYNGAVTGSVGGSTAPFTVTLTKVTTADNTWKADNFWGNFVSGATGQNYDNRYPYPGTIKINCDNTVTVVGTGTVGTGGSGTYNPTTGTITYSLNQGLFTSSFTADITLTVAQ